MTKEERNYKLQVLRFHEELERYLKRYNPYDYSFFAAQIIEDSFNNLELQRSFPLHFLLHSIEANCYYHRKQNNDPIDLKKLHKIIRVYLDYYDPLSNYYLKDKNNPFIWFVTTARQQFYLQSSLGYPDLGRGIELFCKPIYRKSESKFKDEYGLSYKEWFIITFCIHALANRNKPAFFSVDYLTSVLNNILSSEPIEGYLKTVSISPEEIKKNYSLLRDKLGGNAGSYFDFYLRSIFETKPLLKRSDEYLIIHKELFLKTSTEGIFDLQKNDGEFGQEFGRSFEKYVNIAISHLKTQKAIFGESELQKYIDGSVCDYLIMCEDFILFIECKGLGYSSLITSEIAMQKDNSTRKIAIGLEQILSTAIEVNNGTLKDLIGDVNGKPLISIVITFKHLYFTNTIWYWENILTKVVDNNVLSGIENLFSVKTQVLSIDELEKLLVYANQYNKSILEIFYEKTSKPDTLTGDWQSYLELQEDSWLEFLKDTFHEFTNTYIINKVE